MQRTGLSEQDIELTGVQMLSELKRVEQLISDDSTEKRSEQTVAS